MCFEKIFGHEGKEILHFLCIPVDQRCALNARWTHPLLPPLCKSATEIDFCVRLAKLITKNSSRSVVWSEHYGYEVVLLLGRKKEDRDRSRDRVRMRTGLLGIYD